MKQGSIIDGRYKIDKLLGRGGMGQVYSAYDIALEKTVALKLLLPNASENVLKRFWIEAKALSGLDHPNILKVHHFGEYGAGRMYLVMDYIDGVSLFETLDRNAALPFLEVLPIFERICRGLRYAHAHHVLHRDLKPGNVMLARNFEDPVKLVDFGLAKLTDRDYDVTHPGGAMGSPPYISPEVIRGEPADERSDIYSLGCVLFHHLTGRIPFTGKTKMAIMMEHLNTLPPLLSDVSGKEYGENVELFVEKCLRKDANSRFQTMDELMTELERIKTSELEKYEIAGMVAPDDKFVVDDLLLARRKHDDELFARTIKAAAAVGLVAVTAVVVHGYLFKKEELPPVKVERVKVTDLAEIAYDPAVNRKVYSRGPKFKDGVIRSMGPSCLIQGRFTDSDFRKKLEPYRNLRNFACQKVVVSESAMDSLLSISADGLNFIDTPVTPEMLDKISKIPSLKLVKIARAPGFVQGSIKQLNGCPTLETFDFEPPLDAPYANLGADIARLKHVTFVRFYKCNLSREDFGNLALGLDLENLEMVRCVCAPDAFEELSSAKRLEGFYCSKAKLTQEQLDQIAKIPNLKGLDLHETNLSDDDLKRFYKCKKLKYFVVNRTRVTEAGARLLKALRPDMRILLRTAQERNLEHLY